jgi:hypothetical protein
MATKSSRSRTRGNRQQRRADAAGTRRGRAAVRKLETARGKPYSPSYARRLERSFARGLTRSQARGHARAGEARLSTRTSALRDAARAEKTARAFALMREGKSESQAAKAAKISPELLRRERLELADNIKILQHADRLKEERGELNYQFYAELPRDRQISVADDNERLRQEWIENGGQPSRTNKDNPLLYAYHTV